MCPVVSAESVVAGRGRVDTEHDQMLAWTRPSLAGRVMLSSCVKVVCKTQEALLHLRNADLPVTMQHSAECVNLTSGQAQCPDDCPAEFMSAVMIISLLLR